MSNGYLNENKTPDWQLYEAGKKYNNRLDPNYYTMVDTNLAFFNGDQWRNVKANGMPTPVFNIIKRSVSYFVASLLGNKTKIHIESLFPDVVNPAPEMQQAKLAAKIAKDKIDDLLEKFKFDNRLRDVAFDGAVIGEGYIHFYFDPTKKPYGIPYPDVVGEIEIEIKDGTDVIFVNANNKDKNVQPAIIIPGRDLVSNLKQEALKYQQQESEIEAIQTDKNYNYTAGDSGKIEFEADEYGKAQYIIIYRKNKETGTITVSKCVENAYIYKDIDTGLEIYPIVKFNWENIKNCYHGRGVVTGIIPNQIFINRMFAMVMYHLMQTAFPKPIFDGDKVEMWSNEIGAAIELHNLNPGDSIHNMAGYVPAANMSNQIIEAINLAVSLTKDTLGINDAALGNVNPDQASGVSIVATAKQSAIPLENPRANLYEMVEDVGQVLVDMMGTYYGPRPVVIEEDKIDPQTGQPNGTQQVLTMFDFTQLKNSWLSVRAEVGESSYWSEIAAIQTMDNLLKGGFIDIIEYLKRVPEGYIPHKDELITELETKLAMMPPMPPDDNNPPKQ